MRFMILAVLSLAVSSLGFAQTSSSTGRTKIDEQTFNAQLEKCKVDTNNSPVSGSAKNPTNNSSKGKAQ